MEQNTPQFQPAPLNEQELKTLRTTEQWLQGEMNRPDLILVAYQKTAR